MKQSQFGYVAAVVLALGCGGSGSVSGLDGGRQLNSLTAAEQVAFCEWGVAEQGGAQTVDCGNGLEVSISPVDECLEDFVTYQDCDLTVAQMEDCVQAVAADPCSFGGQACAVLFTCLAQ